MIKIDLYSGLLGVGKTTVIRRMLETAYKDQQVVILENEVGKINYDSAVLGSTGISVQKITAGCVCCTVAGDFQRAILQIGEQLHPDVIIIEPTGASDITALMNVIAQIDGAYVNRSIMVLKAHKCHALLSVVGEFFRDQIRCADVLYLNFIEKVKEGKLEPLIEELRAINPNAQIVTVPLSQIDADTFPERNVNLGTGTSLTSESDAPGTGTIASSDAGTAASSAAGDPGAAEMVSTGNEASDSDAERTAETLRVFRRDRSLKVVEEPDTVGAADEKQPGSDETGGNMRSGAAAMQPGGNMRPGSAAMRPGRGGLRSGAAMMRPGAGKRDDQTLYTWDYSFPKPFSDETLQSLSDIFRSPEAEKIWRVKGVLTMADGTRRKYDVSFGDVFEEEWNIESDVPENTLVIIGTEIPKRWLETQFSEKL